MPDYKKLDMSFIYNEGRLTILLYHGVTNILSRGVENYSGKHIDVNSFIKQIKVLKIKYNIISMREVLDLYKSKKKFNKKLVAVTFDDGFSNNEKIAAPILDDFKIPATFYVCTGVINTKKMFWVDEIEDCINSTSLKYFLLDFVTFEKKFFIKTKKQKINAIETIKSYCKKSSLKLKNKIIENLKEATNIQSSVENSENYNKLSWKQLLNISQNNLFTLGAHSNFHDILSKQPKKKMEQDIKSSIKILSQKTKRDIIHYSYPEGQFEHFNNNVIKALKNNGIECCPSAIYGQNTKKTDLFCLKRIMVGFKNINLPINFLEN